MFWLSIAVFVFIAIPIALFAWFSRSALQIQTMGAPTGPTMRSGDQIIALLTWLEPYVPSLSRDHSKDLYSVWILVHNARTGARSVTKLAAGRSKSSLSLCKLVTVKANKVWVDTPETMVFDLVTGKAEPGKAPTRPRTLADFASGDDALRQWLARGAETGNGGWLGFHTATEVTASTRSSQRGAPTLAFDRSREQMRLCRGDVSGDRLRGLRPVGEKAVYGGALIRASRGGKPLDIAGGDWVVIFETKPYRAGSVVASRVDEKGRAVWRIDTGIGEMTDVLPDTEYPAFVGFRPRVPDKVPEPILVVIESQTGRLSTHSLWVTD